MLSRERSVVVMHSVPSTAILALGLLASLSLGCGDSGTAGTTPAAPAPVPEPVPEPEPEPVDPPPGEPAVAGMCTYDNPFSGAFECKEYSGEGWGVAQAQADCDAGPLGNPGDFFAGRHCDVEPTLGDCRVDTTDGMAFFIEIGGNQGRDCAASAQACTGFVGGVFYAGQNCLGYDLPPMSTDVGESTTFQWPTRTCVEALPGEPEGQTDGKVCTWNLISASTEEGRNFVDYGDCEIIYTNRPYYALGPWQVPPVDDPRLEDAQWLAESEWVNTQVRSNACVCCHSDSAPEGPARWDVDAGPLWTDTMSDEAIALFAGRTDSSVLGAFAAADNNGFDRIGSAMPTTDTGRMLRFFRDELVRRGVTEEYLEGLPDVGGPLILQRDFVPEACGDDEGLDAEGRLVWRGQPARYLYVMEPGSANPGIPPNFDLPVGTLWRVDVSFEVDPFESGVSYGSTPPGAFQRFPAGGAPAELVSGETYYLYVLRDVALPLARCLFVAP